MVDLDSNPTKLIEIVEIGKQLLMTRGALTHVFHCQRCRQIFRDYSGHVRRNVSGAGWRSTIMPPEKRRSRTILSAVIFNALIIIALIPLALRGVKYHAIGRRGAAAQQSF